MILTEPLVFFACMLQLQLLIHSNCLHTRRTWVNEPQQAATQVELLTRDADAPEEASGESVAPPPPSKLIAQTLAANGSANSANGSQAAAVNGVTNKLAGLKAWGGRPAPAAAARAAV
jgi:hypothetical protein